MEKDSLTHLTHPMSKHQLMPIWLCEFSLGRETKGKPHKQGVLCSSLKDDTDLAALRQLDNRLLHALSEVFWEVKAEPVQQTQPGVPVWFVFPQK